MPLASDFRFSSQSLQDYTECPRRFLLRYIQKVDWPAEESSPYLAFEQFRMKGNQFHTFVEQYFHSVKPQWIENQIDDEDLFHWWRNFLGFIEKQHFSAVSSEIAFQTSMQGYLLMAKYDLLAQREDGSIVIFDWKTTPSQKKPSHAIFAKKLQTHVYPYVFCSNSKRVSSAMRPIQAGQVELIYWFPQFPDQAEHFPYSSIQMENDEKALFETIEEIVQKENENNDFPKTEEEKHCRFCVYRSLCDRGKKAANIFEEIELDLELGEEELDIDKVEEISY